MKGTSELYISASGFRHRLEYDYSIVLIDFILCPYLFLIPRTYNMQHVTYLMKVRYCSGLGICLLCDLGSSVVDISI
jgi:hypothetical protein